MIQLPWCFRRAYVAEHTLVIEKAGMSRQMNRSSHRTLFLRVFSLVLMTFVVLTAVACSERDDSETVRIADYGNSGADFARELALRYPRREAYSDQEKMASGYIADRLTEMGYSPEIQDFTAVDDDGISKSSQNVIVHLDGHGFRYAPKTKDTGDQTPDKRKDDLIMVVGAHYDTPSVSIEPVSYTHLDVYKRQMHGRRPLPLLLM